jgi:serine/threonine protein kinase/ABC-type branched-subunit amino acid transport system substrate-binding protein
MEVTSKHRLLLELGRGGMGTVYLAVTRGPAGFSKLKVIKRLRPDLAKDEESLKMFLDEARLTARLNHPNIVQTNEVGFDDGNYFIEMEYLEGQSYDSLVRRAAKAMGKVPTEQALYILTQTLAGLHYAHELKSLSGTPLSIVHRDVSPHNIMVTYDGAVKVLDFGIAKAADSRSETTTGVVKGKVTYMAPEQAAHKPLDRRVDVFAVGVMLWEVLTGKRMWAGTPDFGIFLALRKGPPPSPRSVSPNVPEALDAICVKALAYNREDRFATAKEMQLVLEEQLRGAAVGPGVLGQTVCELFAERRAAVTEEIGARMREIEASDDNGGVTSLDVPVLQEARRVLDTATGPSRPGSSPGDERRSSVPGAPRTTTGSGRGSARQVVPSTRDAPSSRRREPAGESSPQRGPTSARQSPSAPDLRSERHRSGAMNAPLDQDATSALLPPEDALPASGKPQDALPTRPPPSRHAAVSAHLPLGELAGDHEPVDGPSPEMDRDARSSTGRERTRSALAREVSKGHRPARARLYAVVTATVLATVALVTWKVQGESQTPTTSAPSRAPSSCVTSKECQVGGARSLCRDGACVAAPECITNAECVDAHGGNPFVCRRSDGRCIDLKQHGCEPHAEVSDLRSNDAIWFGVLLPATGEAGRSFGARWLRAIDLGRRDLSQVAGGISPDPANPRPVALISCDDSTDAADKARYLAEEVGVPAVIGFATNQEAVDLTTKEFIPHHVLSVVAFGPSAVLTSIPHPEGSPRLVWRTTLSNNASAPAVAALVRDVDEPLARSTESAKGGPVRLALLHRGNPAGMAFASALAAVLRFNGKTESENGKDFADVSYGTSTTTDPKADYDRAAHEVIAATPQIVVLFGGDELGTDILEAVEKAWPRSAPRPLYISSSGLPDGMLAFAGGDASRRKRLFGINARSATLPNAQLATHYSEVFADRVTSDTAPAAAYDAFYLLAYAAAAAPADEPMSGEVLARGITRLLPPGPVVDVGPAHILDALGRFKSGGTIDLNGAMSPLDFSVHTGDTTFDLVVTCARVDGSGRAVDEMDSGFEYSRTTGSVRGTNRCR